MTRRIELGDGAALVLDHVPVEISAPAPPPPDPSVAPGAEIVAHGAAPGPAGTVAWSCLRAPAPVWIDGLENAVLAGAGAVARDRLALPALGTEPPEAAPWGHAQAFAGGELVGRSLLGFDHAGHAVVCAVAGPAAMAPDSRLEGTTPRPPPGLATAAIEAAIAHPSVALGGLLLALALASMLLVAFRPRPRSFIHGVRRRRL